MNGQAQSNMPPQLFISWGHKEHSISRADSAKPDQTKSTIYVNSLIAIEKVINFLTILSYLL